MKYPHYYTPLLLAGAIIIALFPMLLGRFYAVGDMHDVFLPLETFFHNQLHAGSIPVWNPDSAFGYPVIASAQIGFFYPPLLFTRLLPVYLYLPLIIVSHLLALTLGMYAFLRKIGASKYSAYSGAISLGLSAFVWQHTTHLNILLAVAWMPWQLWMVQKLVQHKHSTLKEVSFLALLLGTPFLIGQIQMPAFMAIFSSIYYLYTQKKNHTVFSGSAKLFAVAIIAIGIASVQLFPTLELIKFTSRSASGDFNTLQANQHSYPLYHIPSIIFPRFFGNDYSYWGKRLEIEYGFFIGTVPLVMIALALWASRKAWPSTTKFFAYSAGISFLLALGGSSPFRLLGIEPSLWVFSAPARWLYVTTFSLCVISAQAFDLVFKEPTAIKKVTVKANTILKTLVALVILANIVIIAINRYPLTQVVEVKSEYATEKISSITQSLTTSSVSLLSPFTYLPILSLLVVTWTLSTKNPHRKQALLGVLTIELAIIALTTTPTLPWSKILATPATVSALPQNIQQKQVRIYNVRDGGDTGAYFTDPASRANKSTRELQNNLIVPLSNTLFNIPGIEWPASLDMQEVTNSLEGVREENGYAIKNWDTLRELNIGVITSPTELASKEVLYPQEETKEGITITTITDVLPRASLKSGGEVSYKELSPTLQQIDYIATQDDVLTIKNTWYPGWSAPNKQRTILAIY